MGIHSFIHRNASWRRASRADSGSFQRLQQELQANVEARKTFTQQATENEMVLEELKSLEAGANVYKLIGPMLAKQDVVEATSNVTKRLEFINAERTRLEKARRLSRRSSIRHKGIFRFCSSE